MRRGRTTTTASSTSTRADEDGTSTLTVRLHTERAEGEDIDRGVQETVDGIKRAVEEHAGR